MKQGRTSLLKASQGKVITKEVIFEQRSKRGQGVRSDDLGSSFVGRGNSSRLEEEKSLAWLDRRALGASRRWEPRGNRGQTEGAFLQPCEDFDSVWDKSHERAVTWMLLIGSLWLLWELTSGWRGYCNSLSERWWWQQRDLLTCKIGMRWEPRVILSLWPDHLEG